jgi:hypothetical protein
MKMAVFWVVVIALMTEAANISEMSGNVGQTTWHSNTENIHLNNGWHENL